MAAAAATVYVSSPHLLLRPTSGCRSRRFSGARTAVVKASRGEANNDHSYSDGRTVDENMVVLRKRIHEMKMVETDYEPPCHWMEWEKRHYTTYDSKICDAVGLLQSVLMNTRPSLAIGVLALVALSLPTTACLILYQLIEISNGLLAGIHL